VIPTLILHEDHDEEAEEHGEHEGMEHLHSQTEVNLIICALLVGSWGIICTCKYLDEKEAKLAKEKAAQAK
jgi:hypothetical protein